MAERHDLQTGERIGVWTRPNDSSIYHFGYGRFLGDANVNGVMFPAVSFDMEPGKEYVLHYGHIWFGREVNIKNTLDEFKGDVHKMTLTEYLDPKFEAPEAKERRDDGTEARPVKDAPVKRTHETAFDKLYRLGKEVNVHRKKVLLFEMNISEENDSIAAKQKEMADLKSQALSELDALERGDSLEPIDEVTESNEDEGAVAPSPDPDSADADATQQPQDDSVAASPTCEVCDGIAGSCACTD